MAIKKRAAVKSGAAKKTSAKKKDSPVIQHSETYESALEEYGIALGLLRKQDFAGALKALDALIASCGDEPELVDRARTYRAICARKVASAEDDPSDARGRYYRSVVLVNSGRLDEAVEILGRLLAEQPGDASVLYARASAFALQGRSESAVADLRQAVSIEPTIRFQATNDPDFDRIRDDAAFIDVIEPTPAGA